MLIGATAFTTLLFKLSTIIYKGLAEVKLHILTDLKEFNAKIVFQENWDFFHSVRKSDKTTLMTFSALQSFSSFLLVCQTFQLNLIFIKKKNSLKWNCFKLLHKINDITELIKLEKLFDFLCWLNLENYCLLTKEPLWPLKA